MTIKNYGFIFLYKKNSYNLDVFLVLFLEKKNIFVLIK